MGVIIANPEQAGEEISHYLIEEGSTTLHGGNAAIKRPDEHSWGWTAMSMTQRITASGDLRYWWFRTYYANWSFKLKIFRDGGTQWLLIASREFFPSVAGLNEVYLDPPIAVEAGDYVGIWSDRAVWSEGTINMHSGDVTGTTNKTEWTNNEATGKLSNEVAGDVTFVEKLTGWTKPDYAQAADVTFSGTAMNYELAYDGDDSTYASFTESGHYVECRFQNPDHRRMFYLNTLTEFVHTSGTLHVYWYYTKDGTTWINFYHREFSTDYSPRWEPDNVKLPRIVKALRIEVQGDFTGTWKLFTHIVKIFHEEITNGQFTFDLDTEDEYFWVNDAELLADPLYYRSRAVDFDGIPSDYSKIVNTRIYL